MTVRFESGVVEIWIAEHEDIQTKNGCFEGDFPFCCKGSALIFIHPLTFDISATDEPWALQPGGNKRFPGV
jgi:hypothetical protein